MVPEIRPDLPLAAQLRPQSLADFVGQHHLVGPGKPLSEAVARGRLHSLILWGPPGVGKTTLARVMTAACDARLLTLSAVLSGVKEIRAAIEEAQFHRQRGQTTVLFVDEVHRFNTAQQDAFLPSVEDGTLVLVGATTENPSFALNKALLSRCRVYVLERLSIEDIQTLIQRALAAESAQAMVAAWPAGWSDAVAGMADGDGRRSISLMSLLIEAARRTPPPLEPEAFHAWMAAVLQETPRRFDRRGEDFYDLHSALHKSVRGSDPDAALYWLARLLDGGCDPLNVARRVVRMASEDIGLADPRAHTLALEAWTALERLGRPEGELALAEAVVFCAIAAKSNAVYTAWKGAQQAVREQGSLPVPLYLRNAPTALMRAAGYGADYRYAHDAPDAFVAGERYLPEALAGQRWYHPTSRGLEAKIQLKRARLDAANRASPWQRDGD